MTKRTYIVCLCLFVLMIAVSCSSKELKTPTWLQGMWTNTTNDNETIDITTDNIVINTIKGEIIDVYLPFKEQFLDIKGVKLEDILEIFKLKTSWYTIVGPFCLGLTLAGVKKDDISKYEKMLLPLGIAFQIKDDLLGIFSDTSSIGKDCSDISEYKQTLLYYYAINNSKYGDELLKYYGKKHLNSDDISKVRYIFEKSGAKKYAINMMHEYFVKSKSELNKLELSKNLKSIILGFITYLEYRDK